MQEKIAKAMRFAFDRHLGQERKYSKEPYFVHLMGVHDILKLITADEDILIAGLLHDTIEDGVASAQEIRKEFGDKVADIVMQCTKDKEKNFHISSKEAMLVKLADVLHNLSTNDNPWYIEKTLYLWHPNSMIPKYFENPDKRHKTKNQTKKPKATDQNQKPENIGQANQPDRKIECRQCKKFYDLKELSVEHVNLDGGWDIFDEYTCPKGHRFDKG